MHRKDIFLKRFLFNFKQFTIKWTKRFTYAECEKISTIYFLYKYCNQNERKLSNMIFLMLMRKLEHLPYTPESIFFSFLLLSPPSLSAKRSKFHFRMIWGPDIIFWFGWVGSLLLSTFRKHISVHCGINIGPRDLNLHCCQVLLISAYLCSKWCFLPISQL